MAGAGLVGRVAGTSRGGPVRDGGPQAGLLAGDERVIDLRGVPAATIGDEVTILDNDPLSDASAYHLAKWADTIPYEIFCRIGPRVKRVAVDPVDPPVAREDHDERWLTNPD